MFAEQRDDGNLRDLVQPFTAARAEDFNLRMDPYERADITSNTYYDWMFEHAYFVVPAQATVAQFLQTFTEYPPAQRPASFTIDQIQEQMQAADRANRRRGTRAKWMSVGASRMAREHQQHGAAAE